LFILVLSVVLSGAACNSGSSPSPATPTFTTLDAPSAATQPSGFTCGTVPADINADSIIVGTSYAPSPTGGLLGQTVFDPPGVGTAGSKPSRINSAGQIVGSFLDYASVSHGYLRNLDGTFTIIDDPGTVPATGYGTFVTGINDYGAIIGYFYDYRGDCHGFLRQ
jgi:hypothetical protein